MCIDLALKVFLAEKVGAGEGVSRDLMCIFYIEMREIVFL